MDFFSLFILFVVLLSTLQIAGSGHGDLKPSGKSRVTHASKMGPPMTASEHFRPTRQGERAAVLVPRSAGQGDGARRIRWQTFVSAAGRTLVDAFIGAPPPFFPREAVGRLSYSVKQSSDAKAHRENDGSMPMFRHPEVRA